MESHEVVSGDPLMFICFLGKERSVAIQRVFKDSGKDAAYFSGGTRRLSTLTPEEVSRELGRYHPVLIYDQGSSSMEHGCKEKSMDILDKIGKDYTVWDTTKLMIAAIELGKDLGDYLI